MSIQDINHFDHYEMNPCVLLDAKNQAVPYHDPSGEFFEACSEDDPSIAIWTVYGHLQQGGVEALVDCPHKDEAEKVWHAMTDQLAMKTKLLEMATDFSLHINTRSWAAQSVIESMRRQSDSVIGLQMRQHDEEVRRAQWGQEREGAMRP